MVKGKASGKLHTDFLWLRGRLWLEARVGREEASAPARELHRAAAGGTAPQPQRPNLSTMETTSIPGRENARRDLSQGRVSWTTGPVALPLFSEDAKLFQPSPARFRGSTLPLASVQR